LIGVGHVGTSLSPIQTAAHHDDLDAIKYDGWTLFCSFPGSRQFHSPVVLVRLCSRIVQRSPTQTSHVMITFGGKVYVFLTERRRFPEFVPEYVFQLIEHIVDGICKAFAIPQIEEKVPLWMIFDPAQQFAHGAES
jgi:hypothetical protein